MSIVFAPLIAVISVIIIATPLYYGVGLTTPVLFGIPLFLSLSAVIFLSLKPPNKKIYTPREEKTPLSSWLLFTLIIAAHAALLFILFSSQTTDSVLGPWSVIPSFFFVISFFSFLLCITFLLQGARSSLKFIVTTLSFFTFLSVTAILFPLRFDFDPTLHHAAERFIAEYGVILPKTLYYIGHYAVVVLISKLSSLPIDSIDTFLVPVLAATTLPPLLFMCFKRYGASQPLSFLGTLLFLILPLSFFWLSTPWSLSLLLVGCMALFSVGYGTEKGNRLILLCIGLAALAVHPMAGILGLGALLGTALLRRRLLFFLYMAACAVSLPVAFYIQSRIAGNIDVVFRFSPDVLQSFFSSLDVIRITTQFSHLLDGAALFDRNALLITCASVGFALAFVFLKKKNLLSAFAFPLIGALLTLSNFIALRLFTDFPSLISYERFFYADRLLALIILFLSPLLLFSWNMLLERALATHQPKLLRFITVLGFAGILTANLYTTYPRNDAYTTYRGFNISQADINAVRFINHDAGEEPFIVLSNQSVSAAAVREFGFKKYFSDGKNGKTQEIFYYPIPTGGPLYPFFLEMIKKPERQTALEAMNLVEVNRAYLVLNAYESGFKKKREEVKKTTPFWFEIDGGKDIIFLYTRTSPTTSSK